MLNIANHQGNHNEISTSQLSEWLSSKTQITNDGETVEKRELSYTTDRDVNLCIHYRKQYGGFSAISLLGIYLRKKKKRPLVLKRHILSKVHSNIIYSW